MVGIYDPQSSSSAKGTASSSQDSQTNPPPSPSIVLQWPSIRITRPTNGQYTPKVDERCISYCTQTSAGRAAGKEPQCRAICIRHIFAHEVRKLTPTETRLNANNQDPITSPEDQKIPLPPEGQPGPDAVQDALRGVSTSGRRPEEQVRYWKEGWYLWMSSSRWAIQEKFDLMMRDLGWQASWVRTRERRKKQWFEAQKELERRESTQIGEGRRDPANNGEAVAPASSPAWNTVNPNNPTPQNQRRSLPPYISASDESVLIPLPPPDLPLAYEFRELFAPTIKLMGVLRESLVTGQQRELAVKAFETAQTSKPFQLASTVISKMWENWKRGPPEDND